MREKIQAVLEQITTVDAGDYMPEAILETHLTYFGYEIYRNFVSRDNSGNDIYRISLLGFVMRRIDTTEDTLKILETATDAVCDKLKTLNFQVSTQNVSLSESMIRKIKISGVVLYDEMNDKLVY